MNWVILLPPLLAALLIGGLGIHRNKWASIVISVGACSLSLFAACSLFFSPEAGFTSWTWIDIKGVEGLKIDIGGYDDPGGLCRLMLLVVTGVGLLIHIFSIGYMGKDPGVGRFFGKLSLFMFSMLGIVLANNLAMMFIFWELVGVSSYFLIGFWFEKPSAAEASKKAFIVNRVGDFGFLLGILGTWVAFGTLNLDELAGVSAEGIPSTCLLFIALGLFMGCVGKSAQLPLHIWLPDAMEGPTPVSALIHAATMVAAGVYMLCRVFVVLALSPEALEIIAMVGGVTAIFAAVIATQQNDIKKILAYSTLSQLGYMVAAVGLGATGAAMFHLTTHAFFKALLFLGAGSVIYGLHHEQNIWKMGGVGKKMVITFLTFLIGTLALTGFPYLLSGFWSKEAILAEAYHGHPIIFGLLIISATLTTFYMFRLVFVTFFGKERSEAVSHAKESPWVMTIPLLLLTVPSIFAGFAFFGIDPLLGIEHHEETDFGLLGWSIGAFVVGLAGAFLLYWNSAQEKLDSAIFVPLARKFWIDELYECFLVKGQQLVAKGLAGFDRWVIDGILVRGSAVVSAVGGEFLRVIQSGNLQFYLLVFALGVAAILIWMF